MDAPGDADGQAAPEKDNTSYQPHRSNSFPKVEEIKTSFLSSMYMVYLSLDVIRVQNSVSSHLVWRYRNSFVNRLPDCCHGSCLFIQGKGVQRYQTCHISAFECFAER